MICQLELLRFEGLACGSTRFQSKFFLILEQGYDIIPNIIPRFNFQYHKVDKSLHAALS